MNPSQKKANVTISRSETIGSHISDAVCRDSYKIFTSSCVDDCQQLKRSFTCRCAISFRHCPNNTRKNSIDGYDTSSTTHNMIFEFQPEPNTMHICHVINEETNSSSSTSPKVTEQARRSRGSQIFLVYCDSFRDPNCVLVSVNAQTTTTVLASYDD